MFFADLRRGLAHLFYPRLCNGCSKPLTAAEQVLCLGCAAQMPETGHAATPGNDAELLFAGRVPFAHAAALAYFTDDGLLQHLVHGLKYRGQQDIGRYLGTLLGQRLMAAGWGNDVDMIVPVPLHSAKLAARGYNQGALIAEGMAGPMGKPVSTDVLVRVRHTESQTRKTRTQRVSNMQGAFAIQKKDEWKGRHILLCDDILTTGATLEACALALLQEKSIKISIATIGIAVS